ncbi:MAG: hypothetical protein ABIZ04_19410 [Opitutus sp.]
MIIRQLLVGLIVSATGLLAEEPRVSPVRREIRSEFKLSPFYSKWVSAGGIPIVASNQVSDFALLEAQYLVLHMIGHRPDLLTAIAKNHVRLAVMAPTQMTTDIPEHSDLTPKDYWDKRARGLGATDARPAVSCGEENLLAYPGDPYAAENILIHEFGHVVHERGMNAVDPTFDRRLRSAYDAARRAGRWKGKYAGSNHQEYWAEGVQSWFDTNGENDEQHNEVNTRVELKAYDPALATLLGEVFGDGEWRYSVPTKRTPPSPHLVGFDPSKAPTFAWPARLSQGSGATGQAAPTTIPAGGGELPALAPNTQPSWRSGNGGKPTKVLFQNATDRPVQIDWMDYQGQAKTYHTLQPGGKAESATYGGHIWRARDEHGVVLAYFIAGASPGTAVVRSLGR